MVNIFHPPPSVVSSWPKPDYVNPQTQGPGLIVVCVILMCMGFVIVSARIYARLFITRAPGVDDVLIVLAALFATTFSILCIYGNVKKYTGIHIWDLEPSLYVSHRIILWVSEFSLFITLSFTKISVLLFYRRLSVSFSRAFFIAAWVGIVYNILYVIAFVLTLLFICRPLQAWWLNFDPSWLAKHSNSVTCGKERVMEPVSAIFSSISDIYSAALPMILISRLDLPSKQKRALYYLFSLAWLVVISGFLRIVYIYLTVIVAYDFTWRIWELWILCNVEIWVAIFVASAPALKPVVKRLATVVGSSCGCDTGGTKAKPRAAGNESQNRSDETKLGEDPEGIYVMSNGGVTNSQRGHSSPAVWTVATLEDNTKDEEEKGLVRDEEWMARMEAYWNRIGATGS